MVNLLGMKVKHAKYGIGTVTYVEENSITIEFPSKTSKFIYPMAFSKFLAPQDQRLADAINADLDAAIKTEEQKKSEKAAFKAKKEEQRLIALREKNNKSVKKSSVIKNHAETKRVPGQHCTYLVFQGETYDEECNGQFIWAPKYSKSGGRNHYWDRLLDIQKDDIIFHCSNGYIKAISIAKGSCFDSFRPHNVINDSTQWDKDGRKVECDYNILTFPIKHSDYKNEILKYCNVKYSPFDKNGNGVMGYLFDLDRRLANCFLRAAANENKFLYEVPILSEMLVDAQPINSLDELLDNCRLMDKYIASKKDPEYSFALNLIKRGRCFVAICKEGKYRFYPSRFIGYHDNSMLKHENNDKKDGRETNYVIDTILRVGAPISDTTLEELYEQYCRELGFEPNSITAERIEHKFWNLHDLKY